MKKLVAAIGLCGIIALSNFAFAQKTDSVKKVQPDKSKRASPPAQVSETLKTGALLSINYSQPYLKNRTIGKDIAPFDKVWRTGANEATTFEVNKNVKVEGKLLTAGKYSFYTIPGEKEWILIFNKTWNQWGTVYNQELDQLRVQVKPQMNDSSTEMLTYLISKDGLVSINWGKVKVNFKVD